MCVCVAGGKLVVSMILCIRRAVNPARRVFCQDTFCLPCYGYRKKMILVESRNVQLDSQGYGVVMSSGVTVHIQCLFWIFCRTVS